MSWRRTLLLLMLAGACLRANAAEKALSPDEIALKIYLGQVYPSGNVYLRNFSDSLGELKVSSWPAKVVLRGLAKEESGAARFQFASFQRLLKDRLKKTEALSDYIPGIEKMEAGHAPCADVPYEANPAYSYLEPDFFNAVYDHCEPNNGIARYSGASKGTQSFRVIAFPPDLPIEKMKVSDGTQGRPLAPGEADEIAAHKKKNGDCTTVPAFEDEAILLMTFGVADTSYTARISTYDNPGCGGHLETVYILDLLENHSFLKRYDLHLYRGGI